MFSPEPFDKSTFLEKDHDFGPDPPEMIHRWAGAGCAELRQASVFTSLHLPSMANHLPLTPWPLASPGAPSPA